MPRLAYKDLAPDAYAELTALGHYVNTETALEPVLRELVYLRASLRNGCHFCIGMHTAELLKRHEPQSRIDAVRMFDAPENRDSFTPRERAALAWTDAVTDIQQSHASDEAYAAVSEYFDEKELVDLTYAIGVINVWNRLAISFRLEWNPPQRGAVASSAGQGVPGTPAE